MGKQPPMTSQNEHLELYDIIDKLEAEIANLEAEIERLRAGIEEALDCWNHHGGTDAITILERLIKGGDDGRD